MLRCSADNVAISHKNQRHQKTLYLTSFSLSGLLIFRFTFATSIPVKAFHNFIGVPIFALKREIIHIVLEWFLMNASITGGVFSLLSAHLANLLLHHEKVSRPYLKLVGVLSVSSLEVGLAIYRRFAPTSKDYLKVGFVAQLAGIFSGLTIGLVTNYMPFLTIQKGTQLSQGTLMHSSIPYH